MFTVQLQLIGATRLPSGWHVSEPTQEKKIEAATAILDKAKKKWKGKEQEKRKKAKKVGYLSRFSVAAEEGLLEPCWERVAPRAREEKAVMD